MIRKEIFEELKKAITDLDDDKVAALVQECMKAGVPPLDVIVKGLAPGLTIIGDEYAKNDRFMSDLMISGQIMNDAMEKMLPTGNVVASIEHRKPGEHVMVIGTVEGDLHNIGKRIVSAFFSGAGIKAIDIGEDQPASAFVEAIKKYKPTIVGASAIIGPVVPYCGVIHRAMVDAGVRDDVIYVTGGWGMTPEWCDEVGADTYGENAFVALDRVQAILKGKARKWRERVKK
jgi:methanogenic corrinoid protein MtbC1